MTNTRLILEVFGYIGSALVLISFLMASVFKLRVVNSIGSCISTVYALITHTYPIAVMNACLVIINVYYLIKMSKSEKQYDLVKASPEDSLLKYTIDKYKDDILKYFPANALDFSNANTSYVICHDGKPAGLMIGTQENGTIDLVLDYATPEYRDFSVGNFIFSKLPMEGVNKVICKDTDQNRKQYLDKFGFKKIGDYYEKIL